MVIPKLDYAAPDTLETAIALARDNPGACFLAGGHSLLLNIKFRRTQASMVVDLRKIKQLYGIHPLSNGLRIGAMTTCAEIAESDLVQEKFPALAEAAGSIGDIQVRNGSTIGGGLINNDPSGDFTAVALALWGVFTVVGPAGERTYSTAQFFQEPKRTILGHAEVLTSVDFTTAGSGESSAYEKFKNPANGYAICGVAARVMHTAGKLEYRLAVNGATPAAMRLSAAEAALAGKQPTSRNIQAALSDVVETLPLVTDLFAGAAYRGQLVKVLTEQAILRAASKAGEI